MAKPKLSTPLPKSLWAIVDGLGRYRYCNGLGIPELFKNRWEANNQNTHGQNGDRVIKVTLYHPVNNFRK